MLKYLLLIAIGTVVWWVWRQRTKAAAQVRRQEAPPEPMVSCAHCGVHLPRSESLAEAGKYYCCADHSRVEDK